MKEEVSKEDEGLVVIVAIFEIELVVLSLLEGMSLLS